MTPSLVPTIGCGCGICLYFQIKSPNKSHDAVIGSNYWLWLAGLSRRPCLSNVRVVQMMQIRYKCVMFRLVKTFMLLF
jgi:hypothetical protein